MLQVTTKVVDTRSDFVGQEWEKEKKKGGKVDNLLATWV